MTSFSLSDNEPGSCLYSFCPNPYKQGLVVLWHSSGAIMLQHVARRDVNVASARSILITAAAACRHTDGEQGRAVGTSRANTSQSNTRRKIPPLFFYEHCYPRSGSSFKKPRFLIHREKKEVVTKASAGEAGKILPNTPKIIGKGHTACKATLFWSAFPPSVNFDSKPAAFQESLMLQTVRKRRALVLSTKT